MCECQRIIEQEIKKKYDASFTLNTKGPFGYVKTKNPFDCELVISLPILNTDDHSLGFTLSGHHLVTARYCPFCGAVLC